MVERVEKHKKGMLHSDTLCPPLPHPLPLPPPVRTLCLQLPRSPSHSIVTTLHREEGFSLTPKATGLCLVLCACVRSSSLHHEVDGGEQETGDYVISSTWQEREVPLSDITCMFLITVFSHITVNFIHFRELYMIISGTMFGVSEPYLLYKYALLQCCTYFIVTS